MIVFEPTVQYYKNKINKRHLSYRNRNLLESVYYFLLILKKLYIDRNGGIWISSKDPVMMKLKLQQSSIFCFKTFGNHYLLISEEIWEIYSRNLRIFFCSYKTGVKWKNQIFRWINKFSRKESLEKQLWCPAENRFRIFEN
jgi:hypothetical protein